MCKITRVVSLLLLVTRVVQGGEFINLDFELANTNTSQMFPTTLGFVYGSGPVSDLLPGWQLSRGGTNETLLFFNNLPPDPVGQSLISKEALNFYQEVFGRGGFQGEYVLAFTTDQIPFVLSQTGEVPADARLLTVRWGGYGPLFREIRINGTLIENGDVSAFAGQLVELQLIMQSGGAPSYFAVDTISFSVPEPGTLVLMGAAGIGLLLWRCAVEGRLQRRFQIGADPGGDQGEKSGAVKT